MDSLYYCPVSARFSTSSFELLTPNDTPIQRFERTADDLRTVLESLDISVLQELDAASDACMAAFSKDGDQTVIISRDVYGANDLERITDELLAAAGHPEVSGLVRSLVSPAGHVVVVVDYVPEAAQIHTAEQAAALIDGLQHLHAHDLVHGGINERFLNADNPEGRRVFGAGLSELYAAWRRNAGLKLGELRADPRFASPKDLRGEAATFESDNFALAATILSEIEEDSSAAPALAPVQGVNALLEKARQRDLLVERAQAVGDRRVRDDLLVMMSPIKEPDLRMWRITVLIVSGLSALMLLWLVIPSSSDNGEDPNELRALQSVQCRGPNVAIVEGKCEPSSVFAMCGDGTVLDTETRTCVALAPDDAERDDGDEQESEIAVDTAGEHEGIHPVLECGEGVRKISQRFSFSDDDLNLSQGERTRLSRLTTQCSGTASIVYYVSKPDLGSRTNTIYREFRSSSSCGTRCSEALPEEPTAVVHIPYVGSIERSVSHYLFFHCCP